MTDPIQHVIVLMLENRSFDHMLGCYQSKYPTMAGIDPATVRVNRDLQGRTIPQAPGAAFAFGGTVDLPHEANEVAVQINGGAMDGFASACAAKNGADSPMVAECMKYFERGRLPALHALAEQFLICDHWFASVPGPTWTNRLFAHSGTSLGRVRMPAGLLNLSLHWYDQQTIYDRLNERSVPWRIYFHDFPQSLLLTHQSTNPLNATRYRRIDEFFVDIAQDEATFPAYTFIEPAYFDPGANDDHPPHDVQKGQQLIADVYNALRANEKLWQATLLVVVYDEHGGFYDHVPPPPPSASFQPDGHTEEFAFDRLGVRVPALLVSPYASAGVASTVFDHTSILKYAIDKWNLRPLTARLQAVGDIGAVLGAVPRADCPLFIPGTLGGAGVSATPVEELSSNQNALVALSQSLEADSTTDPNLIAARSKQVLLGPAGQVAAACDRLDGFLAAQSAALSLKPSAS